MIRKIILIVLSSLIFLNILHCSTIEQTSNNPPGVIINHSINSTEVYLGSPTICILSNGDYLVAYDEFGSGTKGQPTKTHIYKSTNEGFEWKYLTTINGQTWSTLFEFHDAVYIIGTIAPNNSLIIRKSLDGGLTWTDPADSLHNGLLISGKYGTAPVPIVVFGNRIWRAVEAVNPNFKKWPQNYSAMVISAEEMSDIMKANSWTKTNVLPYDSTYLNGNFNGWLEGNIVVDKEGKIKLIMRVDVPAGQDEYAAIINVSDNGKTISFNPDSGFVKMPGASKKFTIRYDEISGRYWSLVNYIPPSLKYRRPQNVRNILAICSSTDLRTWTIHKKILEHPDTQCHAFQYADLFIDGDDMIFVSRTAYDDNFGGADSFHNSNYITFHRINQFRNYIGMELK